jgi:hypothetical protein
VFYDQQRKPVAYVDVCLACMNGAAQPAAPGSIDYPALADLIEELKLPLGPYVPDAKTYRKERESWRITRAAKK